jgi:hypothetical protein
VPNEILSGAFLSGAWANVALLAARQATMTLAAATAIAVIDILCSGMNPFSPVTAARLRERGRKGE